MAPRPVIYFIAVHVVISLGGVIAHVKTHPLQESLYHFWASPASAFSLLVIPYLYCRPSTVRWGFLLNAFMVVIGTVGMSYYSVLTLEGPVSLYRMFTETTLAAILILWTKLPVAYFILVRMRPAEQFRPRKGCARWQKE